MSRQHIRILVDGHGGDAAPEMVLDALESALKADFSAQQPGHLQLGIVGQEDVIRPLLQARGIEQSVELVTASEVVGMCESPLHALRRKKDSSMHVGARCVRDGHWDALVSAGNTGALMAVCRGRGVWDTP